MNRTLNMIAVSVFAGLLLTLLSFFVTRDYDHRILFCTEKNLEYNSHGFPKAYYDGTFPENCRPPFTGALSELDAGAHFYLGKFIFNLVFWSIVSTPFVFAVYKLKPKPKPKPKREKR